MTDSVSIIYRIPGKPPAILTFDGAKHDWLSVCKWIEGRLFPNMDIAAQNARADAILARIRKERRK